MGEGEGWDFVSKASPLHEFVILFFLLFYFFFGGGIEGGNNLLPQSKLTVTVNVRKRNLKAEENILVRLRKLAPSRNIVYTGTWTLTLIYLSVKPRLLMKNVDRQVKSQKLTFKASLLKLLRRTHIYFV